MSHLSPADLVLFQTGDDAADRADLSAHLANCAHCRAELDAIRRTLEAFDAVEAPDVDPGYGQRVWNLIESRLDVPPVPTRLERGWSGRFRDWWPYAAMAAATAGMLALVVSAPRRSDVGVPAAQESRPESGPAVSERVLLTAVSEHLERTGMMLTDLNTAEDAAEVFDVSRVAADLADANRLYRQSAAFSGETDVADMLDDLERVLIEVAHVSRDSTDLDGLRGRLDTDDVAFRVRLAGVALREREHAL